MAWTPDKTESRWITKPPTCCNHLRVYTCKLWNFEPFKTYFPGADSSKGGCAIKSRLIFTDSVGQNRGSTIFVQFCEGWKNLYVVDSAVYRSNNRPLVIRLVIDTGILFRRVMMRLFRSRPDLDIFTNTHGTNANLEKSHFTSTSK